MQLVLGVQYVWCKSQLLCLHISCQYLRRDFCKQKFTFKPAGKASLVWLDIVHRNPSTFSFTNSNPTLSPDTLLLENGS